VEAAWEQARCGYRRLEILVRESGMQVNHKRVFRVYRELGLTVRRRKRKRLERVGAPRVPLTAANQEWLWILCTMRRRAGEPSAY
jgi:putative transposase